MMLHKLARFAMSVIHSDVILISFLMYFAIIGQAAVTTNYDSKILELLLIIMDTIIIYRRIRDFKRIYDTISKLN